MSNTRDAIINSLGEFKLDLLGVVNLFGGDIALSAIHYCVLERRRTYWSAYLSPGSFTVATKLLKRTDNPLAASLSPGQRDECRDIVGLLEAGKYSYIGMLSGTRAKVGNAIGEAVLNTAQKRSKPRVKGAKDSARITKVDVVSVRLDPDADKDEKKLIRSYESLPRWYDILFPIITIVMFVFVSWLGDVVGALMVIIGAISNMLLLGAACASGCTYMPGKPFHGSPDGNAVVTTDLSPNQLWVVLGKEDAVQRLVQRPVVVELNTFWSAVNFVAGLEVYAYTAFSIIALPFVSAPVQLILGALYFLGMFANITYARRDGDALLSKIAEKDMGLKYKESWQFPNRTSAVAYCVLRCKSDSNNLDGLLPNNTPVWIQWRNLLTHFAEPQALKCDIEKTQELLKHWQEKPEIEEIKNSESKALWDRLISDLILAKEAYLEESSPDVT